MSRWWKPDNPHAVHIVTVTHGEGKTLPDVHRALLQTEYPFTWTIVANAPTFTNLDFINRIQDDLYAVQVNAENLGKPKAANQGWRKRGDWPHTCILDHDTVPLDPKWLHQLVDIAEHCPEAGIIGHSLERYNWNLVTIGGGMQQKTVQLQPSHLGGACMLIPRRTWELCGYLNEELPPYAEDDALYGWKVRKAGLLCVYYHSENGRSMRHIDNDTPAYRAWKDARREEATEIKDRLIAEYEAGRPLNT